MKSSYGAVLTDFFFAWGRFNRKWGRYGQGPFWTGAVLTGNPCNSVGSPCLEVWQMLDVWLDTCTCRWNMKCILWFWITCNLQEYAMLCFKSMHQILVNITCVTFMLIMKTCTCTMYMHKMYMYNVYVLTGNSFCRKWMKSTPCLWMKSIVHWVWNQQDTFLYMSKN